MKKKLLLLLLGFALTVTAAVGVFHVLSRPTEPRLTASVLAASEAGQNILITAENGVWSLCLPACTDRRAVTLVSAYDLSVGDVFLAANEPTAVDFSGYPEQDGVTSVTLTLGEQTHSLELLFSSSLPSLFLSIDESRGTLAAVEADKTKQTACYGEGLLILPNEETQSLGAFSLAGRGNSTWQRKKNPYKLNLEKKRDLLSMGSSEKWALLALYDDPSLIRNQLGLSLAERLGFSYVPETEPVDLYIDGVYRGTYALTERIKIEPDRLNITDLEETADAVLDVWNDAYDTRFTTLAELMDSAPEACVLSDDFTRLTVSLPAADVTVDLTKGYLLEIDYYTDSPQLTLPGGTKITVKSPENLASDITHPLFTYLSQYLAAAEASLAAEDESFVRYFDLPSFSKAWLIKEFTMDFDACVSLYMTLNGDTLEAGPMWDLENIFALNREIYGGANPYFQVIAHGGRHETTESWLTSLAKKPVFLTTVADTYALFADVFDADAVCDTAEAMLDTVEASARMNARLYPEKVKTDERAWLLSFIRQRAEAFATVIKEATA